MIECGVIHEISNGAVGADGASVNVKFNYIMALEGKVGTELCFYYIKKI